MTSTIRERILRFTESVEELPINLGRWLLFLGAIIVLRHFLEQVSGQHKTLYFLSYFIHYPLAYVAPLLTLSVILASLSRERIERVTRLMLFAWLLTLLPPLIDLLFTRGGGNPELIGYLIPKGESLGPAFLNLFNPAFREFQGTTAGIRIEAALGCVLAAVYVHLKTRNIGRAIASFFIVYVAMFFFFALPPIVTAAAKLFDPNTSNVYQLFFAKASVHRAFVNATPFGLSDLSNSLIDLLVIAPILALWYRLYDREKFAVARRCIDPVQVPYHLVMTFAGLVLGARLLLNSTGLLTVSHPFDAISIAGILAASFFAAVSAVALRNLHEPSRVDAPPNDTDTLRTIAVTSFAFASLFALSVSYVALTHVLSILAIYYLYYAPPFRFSRFTPLAGFAIGGATVFSILLGYSAYAGGAAALWFPRSLLTVALLVPTLALTARDLWQAPEGLSNRFHLSHLAGEGQARIVAGVAVFVASIAPAFALKLPLLAIPGVVVGVLGLLLLTRQRPSVLPGGLGILAACLLVAAFLMNATSADVLTEELSRTGFAEVERQSSSFEMIDTDAAPEVQRHLQKGIDRFRRNDLDGARESFRLAIEADPENTAAYVSIGSVYLRLNRLEEALRAFRRAISLSPDDARAHVGLGQTYKLTGDPDNAILELERALELDPESADAAYSLSLVHADLRNVEEELEALVLTISIDPQNSLAHSRLADIHLANGRFREALASLKAVLTGRTPVEHAHTRLAEAYYELGDLESAEDELRKQIIFRPKSPSAHASLARLLSELGRKNEAKAEILRALELTENERLLAVFQQELDALEE